MRPLLFIIMGVQLFLRAPVGALASGAYPLGEDGVVGMVRSHQVRENESLHEIARDYGLGYNEITAANPGVNPWIPAEGSRVVIPTRWVLPDAPPRGIVVNLAEMRLYHYFQVEGRTFVRTYPIGVGDEGYETPRGTFHITGTRKNPAWYVPASVRRERPELPAVVPPGPDNPLGSYAIRFSAPGDYLIHGTDFAYGVGRRVSHGCIRLYPEDIGVLAGAVGPGTQVTIVYQPVKVGMEGGTVYLEAHEDYLGVWGESNRPTAALLQQRGLLGRVESAALLNALRERTGMPVPLH
jgi:L,D-transpeptidase ErfK/SrfK